MLHCPLPVRHCSVPSLARRAQVGGLLRKPSSFPNLAESQLYRFGFALPHKTRHSSSAASSRQRGIHRCCFPLLIDLKLPGKLSPSSLPQREVDMCGTQHPLCYPKPAPCSFPLCCRARGLMLPWEEGRDVQKRLVSKNCSGRRSLSLSAGAWALPNVAESWEKPKTSRSPASCVSHLPAGEKAQLSIQGKG